MAADEEAIAWRERRSRRWDVPERFGFPDARTTMGCVAAPFLAGFSLTASLVTLSLLSTVSPWHEWASAMFLAAAVLFLLTVHSTLWARAYMTTAKQIWDWWPERAPDEVDLAWLRAEQRTHSRGFDLWSGRAVVTYDNGVFLVMLGLTFVVIPSEGHFTAPRVIAICVGGLACLIEVLWRTLARVSRSRIGRREDRVRQGLAAGQRAWWEGFFRPGPVTPNHQSPDSPGQPPLGTGN
ncbi:hypothetical protein [Streptomyces sp. NPDC058084]|uniref:hypothetical protein n=1 Tax=Streptomyces sp. NPDC058084 TaxID=3346333 RepID=UPI0036EDDCCC